MATPRKRYFIVAEKVLNRQWSNDQLAGLVRLMAYLNARWASEGIDHDEAGYAEISKSDAMKITGKGRVDVAAKSLRSLADIAEMSVQRRGDVFVILWPNFPVFQGYGTRKSGTSCLSESDPDPEADEVSEDAPRAPLLESGDRLSPKRVADVKAMQPRGVTYTEEQIQAWWAVVAPKMRALGYKQPTRAAPNWWARVRYDEVQAAMDARAIRTMQKRAASPDPPADFDFDLDLSPRNA